MVRLCPSFRTRTKERFYEDGPVWVKEYECVEKNSSEGVEMWVHTPDGIMDCYH